MMPQSQDSNSSNDSDAWWAQVPDVTLEEGRQCIPSDPEDSSFSDSDCENSAESCMTPQRKQPGRNTEQPPSTLRKPCPSVTDRPLMLVPETLLHPMSQKAEEEAEWTPSRPGQGVTPVANRLGRINVGGSTPGGPVSPTRQKSTAPSKPIVTDSDDDDDDSDTSTSTYPFEDDDNSSSRQTSWSSIATVQSDSSPSRKRTRPSAEAEQPQSSKMMRTSEKGKAPIPSSPPRHAPLLPDDEMMTSPVHDSRRSPTRHYKRTTSTESSSSTEFWCGPSSVAGPSSDEVNVVSLSSPMEVDRVPSNAFVSTETAAQTTVVTASSISRTTSAESSLFSGFLPGKSGSSAGSNTTRNASIPILTSQELAPGTSAPAIPASSTSNTDANAGTSFISSSPPSVSAPTTSGEQSSIQQLFKPLYLPHHVIAYDERVQALFDDLKKPVPWGTQFMLAAGVTRRDWTWDEVLREMEHFAGKADPEVMHEVQSIMGREVLGSSDVLENIGKEYHREQKAIEENEGRGLGCRGDYEGEENWYGGQIQQIATLVKKPKSKDSNSDSAEFELVLEPLEMRRSSRFTRMLGSRRILQMRINSDFLLSSKGNNGEKSDRDKVMEFLSHKFILNGRVFVVTPPKDDGIYAIEVDEDFGRPVYRVPQRFGDQFRISLGDFLEHHNPLQLNKGQPTSKFFARWALQMSTSIPVIEFEKDDIYFIDDIVVPSVEGKPESHQILTDGCGFINKSALIRIMHQMKYDSIPTAVQARIAGSKGLFILDPHNNETQPKIWIRASQKKIEYPKKIEDSQLTERTRKFLWQTRAHRILDLVHVSHPSPSSSVVSLSQQSILNMSHNGVSNGVFLSLMEKGLREALRPLLEWQGRWAMVQLWDAINRTGRVTGTRLARLAPSVSRAFGFAGREWARGDTGGADDETSISASGAGSVGGSQSADETSDQEKESLGLLDIINPSYTGRDAISGAPASLHERALEKVQAGFNPTYDEDLRDGVRWILKTHIKSYIEKCHFPLPDGTAVEAFVVPDPLGVLKEGEIYFKPSNPIKDSVAQENVDVLVGDVLIGRYPIRLPSDIQKVTAVEVHALKRWTDVVIVPTVHVNNVPEYGQASFMSILSGGDMDGDTVFVTWHKDIVTQFQGERLIPPPKDLEDDFERQVEQVSSFIERLAELPIKERQIAFQQKYLSGMAHFNVGLYSVFHDVAVRTKGYKDEDAIRLAYKFNNVLDGPKTGRVLKGDIFIQDKKTWERDRPPHKSKAKDRLAKDLLAQRPGFILDVLQEAGENLEMQYLQEFDIKNGRHFEHKHNETIRPDPDLRRPWQELQDLRDLGPQSRSDLEAELELVQKHVKASYKAFCNGAASSSSSNNPFIQQTQPRGRKGKTPRKDCMIEAKRIFAGPIDGVPILSKMGNLESIKASCAYDVKGKFGFCVAFHQLCTIKAAASFGGSAPSSRIFDEVKSIPSSCRRLFDRSLE
ncbi:hypothetical protein D9758_008586 [Tetrapyrgos nigripes]|uniref:RNA-dependent RNA polymerase n=1 Tax=Tetrapyrgos nigripes TaxID=182062 RepID=A0A8H5G5S9_9AGAR|nr:hypothetical protein D9758_008586 [Tetrapyrgos nigripes]